MGAAMIARVKPDIILITNFDYDLLLLGAQAFADHVSALGWDMPFVFAYAPNTGIRTGHDINGDGYDSGPRDMQGYGTFPGQGGMVLLSKHPANEARSEDFSGMLWRDLPGNTQSDASRLADTQRLASVGQWRVRYDIGSHFLDVLVWHAGTPAFDDDSGRNARRNGDENRFWLSYLNGEVGKPPETDQFVLLGTSNLDPDDGLGRRDIMRALLDHPALQDPGPESDGARQAAIGDGGANARHKGDPARDTADFGDAPGPGNLRVDYLLPASALAVGNSGVFWPAANSADHALISGRDKSRSWHGIVWADLVLQ